MTSSADLKGFAKFLLTSSSIYLNGRRLYADEITVTGETFNHGTCTGLSIHSLVNGHGYNLWSLYLSHKAYLARRR